jgi:hypothetical protein
MRNLFSFSERLAEGRDRLFMPTQGWNQTLVTQRTAGTLFATFTTAKTVINQQDLYGFYANYFQLGSKLRIKVRGAVSNIVTTPGTMSFQVMLGSVIAWTSGAVQLNATAHTTLPFALDIDLTCQLTNTAVGGAVAKLMGLGVLSGIMFTNTAAQVDGVNSMTIITVPVTNPALGTAFDSTVSQILDFWVGFSISNGGNGIRIDQYDVEALNMPAS